MPLVSPRIPRGLSLNNPGNIKHSPTQWLGEIPSRDQVFKQFESLQWGVRAAGKLLLNYFHIYHLDTVAKLVSRWAPPVENQTQVYIERVALALRVGPDDPLVLDEVTLRALLTAIFRQEQGPIPVEGEAFRSGLDMALGLPHNPAAPHRGS